MSGRKAKAANRTALYPDRPNKRKWDKLAFVGSPRGDEDLDRQALLNAVQAAQGEIQASHPIPVYLQKALLRFGEVHGEFVHQLVAVRRVNALARNGVAVTRDKAYQMVAESMTASIGIEFTAGWVEGVHQNGPKLRKSRK